MNTYLVIITTVLVITQVIRLVQNVVQLRRQKVLFEKQLGHLEDVTEEDLNIQKKYYRLAVEWFEDQKEEKTAWWEDLGSWRYPRYRCSKCYACNGSKDSHCPNCGREMIESFRKA